MEQTVKKELLRQLTWDYNILPEEMEAVLEGRKTQAGHYTRLMLFRKIIETYPWFTVLQLFTPAEIRSLLTVDLIKNLRAPSLRNHYEFIYDRLQKDLPATG